MDKMLPPSFILRIFMALLKTHLMNLKYISYTLVSLMILISCKSSTPHTYHKTQPSTPKASQRPPSSHSNNVVVQKAKTYLGTPYKYSGLDHKGIDCSGLVYVSFQEIHVTMPRVAEDQSKKGRRIYIGELHAGDLVFFKEKKSSSKITHVGIISNTDYPNSVTFIHASTSKGVREDELMTGYWKDLYLMAVRVN